MTKQEAKDKAEALNLVATSKYCPYKSYDKCYCKCALFIEAYPYKIDHLNDDVDDWGSTSFAGCANLLTAINLGNL